METADFEQLVEEALDSLPEDIARMMNNVQVVVEPWPPPEVAQRLRRGQLLLGLYHGIPLTKRGHYDRALPDKISIYQGSIERVARTPDAVREQVRRTVIHEVAHHFGISDARLRELGW
ncbi:MAG: metallopeptidase family protein [Actinomycetota bacterium]